MTVLKVELSTKTQVESEKIKKASSYLKIVLESVVGVSFIVKIELDQYIVKLSCQHITLGRTGGKKRQGR